MSNIINISGQTVPVRGNDIDTDRIIPSRFLKSIVFEGLGENAFEDDRLQLQAKGETHPFDIPAFQNASVLLVNKNFGCGSSREHAPQSLMRWGINAIIGESYSEIFYGNNVSIGVPCLTVSETDIAKLMDLSESSPEAILSIDLDSKTITMGDLTISAGIEDGPREQFLNGTWDVTAQLLNSAKEIDELANTLPYFNDWK